jgi:hypothetical protein
MDRQAAKQTLQIADGARASEQSLRRPVAGLDLEREIARAEPEQKIHFCLSPLRGGPVGDRLKAVVLFPVGPQNGKDPASNHAPPASPPGSKPALGGSRQTGIDPI